MRDVRSSEESTNGAVDDREMQTVSLPEDVVARVERRLPRTDFETAAEYITFVLEETLARVEADTQDDDAVQESEVRARLESLGYLE